MKMTRANHLHGFGFKSYNFPAYWWICMLLILLNQIWVGIDILLNIFTTYGSDLRLQVTVFIRVSQIH